MKNLSAWWYRGRCWMHLLRDNLSRKYRAIHSKHKQFSRGQSWWKKDLGELLSDLNQLRLRRQTGVSSKSVSDITPHLWAASSSRNQSGHRIFMRIFGQLLDAIPASLESVHVLSQLNKAAKEAGLHLELFKPLTEEANVYYVVLPIEVRLRGDYNAIARFLELVSKMQHLVTVDVVILPTTKNENQVVLASLLKAYRYKDLPQKSQNKAAYATP